MARTGTAVVVHERFPHSVEFPSARPAMLLRDRGMQVHVVELGSARRWQAEGVTRWRRPSRTSLAALVARLRPELLFLEGSTWQPMLMPFGRRTWVRATGRSNRPALARLQRRLLRHASVVSTSNPHFAGAWELPADRLLDFPYPVDVDFWSARVTRDDDFWTSRDLDVPGGPVVSYAAQLRSLKRQPQVVEALAPLLRADPSMRLVFAGACVETGADEAILAAAAAAGVKDQVVLLGALSREELRRLFRWSTVHVVNSTSETQCLALYESLAAEVANTVSAIPVLTSAFPAMPAHPDEAELCANVGRLIADADLRRAVVDSAQERVRWSDVRRHDTLFADTVDRLLG